MTDISALFERLKKNKLVLPALAVGAVAGGYLLLKGGGSGGGITAQDTATNPTQPTTGGGSGGGGGDTSGQTDAAISALQQQQQSFQQSLVDQFNALVSSVTGALGQQQSQTQAAIDALAQQQSALAQNQSPQATLGNLPDFASLFAALQAPALQQGAYKSPGIAGLGGGGIGLQGLKPGVFNHPTGLLKNPGRLTFPHALSNYPPMRPITPMQHAVRPYHPPQRITYPRQTVTVRGHSATSNRSGNRLIG